MRNVTSRDVVNHYLYSRVIPVRTLIKDSNATETVGGHDIPNRHLVYFDQARGDAEKDETLILQEYIISLTTKSASTLVSPARCTIWCFVCIASSIMTLHNASWNPIPSLVSFY